MTKYHGFVGFADTVETAPGVWEENIIDKEYRGDILKNVRRAQSSDKLNDDITTSNEISIVADIYAFSNFHMIKYATFMGGKWKVTSVDIQFPRLNLSLGGIYND